MTTELSAPATATLPNFDARWNYGDPAATEKEFREILPQAEATGNFEYLGQLLTQIARCEGLQGRFDASHATLDSAEKVIAEHDLKLAHVRYFLESGRAFNSSGKQDKAIPLFHSAYELATEQHELRYAIDAVHMIAIAERDPRRQVEWNLRGIALCEAEPNQKGWLNALLNNIGESYLLLEEYDNAAATFQRLSEIQVQRSGVADMFTVKDLAKASRLGGNPKKSVELMQPILDKLLKEKQDDGYIRQELAEGLYATGHQDEAKPHFSKAFELLSKDSWARQNEPEKVARMKELSL